MIQLPEDTAWQLLAAIREAVPWVTKAKEREALQFAADRLATSLGEAYQKDAQPPLFEETEGES